VEKVKKILFLGLEITEEAFNAGRNSGYCPTIEIPDSEFFGVVYCNNQFLRTQNLLNGFDAINVPHLEVNCLGYLQFQRINDKILIPVSYEVSPFSYEFWLEVYCYFTNLRELCHLDYFPEETPAYMRLIVEHYKLT
jgi:hypothetical protein